MRIFQTFVLPDNLVAKYKLSFAAANFSRNLISGGMFDKVFSLIPVNVTGDLGKIEEESYDVVYSKWRNKCGLLRKFAIFTEQWKVFKQIKRRDSIWFYNINFLNAYLFLLLKLFKPSVKLNVIVLDFTPPKSWKEQNYWFLKLINSADGAIYLSPSQLYKVKHAAILPGVVPLNLDENPQITMPKKAFLLSGVISSAIAMTPAVLEAFCNNPECILHITGKVIEHEDLIKDYASRYPNIIYHGAISFDRYLDLLHNVTFQLSTRDPHMPENMNNFPSKIIEALLHNRIVISTIKYQQLDGINYISLQPWNLNRSISDIAKMSDVQLLEYANQEDKLKQMFGTDTWESTIKRIESQK